MNVKCKSACYLAESLHQANPRPSQGSAESKDPGLNHNTVNTPEVMTSYF